MLIHIPELSTIQGISYGTLVDSINKFNKSASQMKQVIFQSRLDVQRIPVSETSAFLNSINSCLGYWKDVADKLDLLLNAVIGRVGIYAIKYDTVKDVIKYDNDYAVVLPFTDGIFKGIANDDMEDPEDIKDFAIHTVRKAFNGVSYEPASYLDSIGRMVDGLYKQPSNQLDAKVFDAVIKQRLFDPNDIREISRSAQKAIDFLVNNIERFTFVNNYGLNANPMKTFGAAIGCIIDMITYTITVYASRVFVIYSYVYPYLKASNNNKQTESAKYESANEEDDDDEDENDNEEKEDDDDDDNDKSNTDELSVSMPGYDTAEVTIMKSANELYMRDPEQLKSFQEIIDVFLGAIGAPDQSDKTYQQAWTKENIILDKLRNNGLYEYLDKTNYHEDCDPSEGEHVLNVLVEVITDPKHPLDKGYCSPKNEFITTIRDFPVDPTVKSCRDAAAALRNATMFTCTSVARSIKYLTNRSFDTFKSHNIMISDIKRKSEITKLLIELYHDLAVCFIQKFRDIEDKFNQATRVDAARTAAKLELHLISKDQDNTKHTMMTAVPDTIRTPILIAEMYSDPMFDELQMYNSYLSKFPEFRESYLFEADVASTSGVPMKSLWDKLKAFIMGIIKRIQNYIDDKNTQNAIRWVHNNADRVNSLSFQGAKMTDVVPFKSTIGTPPGFENLNNGIKNCDPAKLLTKSDVDNFIKSLYPSEAVYAFWANKEGNDDSGNKLYHNYILYYDDPRNTKTEPPERLTLSDDAIKKYLSDWIDSIKGIDKTMETLKQMNNDFTRSINTLQQKSEAHINQAKQDHENKKKEEKKANQSDNNGGNNEKKNPPITSSDKGDVSASEAQAAKSDESNTSSGNGNSIANAIKANLNQKKTEEEAVAEYLIAQLLTTQTRLYSSLINALISYIRVAYSMIQRAYGLGAKTN